MQAAAGSKSGPNHRALVHFRILWSATSLLLLTACLEAQSGYFGDDVKGADIQQVIDSQIAPYISSYDSKLKVDPSECPTNLDVSKGKAAYCTLPVDGIALPVKVVYSGHPPQGATANLDGSFFEVKGIESMLERDLNVAYGISAKAHCPGTVVQVLRPGTRFTCSVTGAPLVKAVHVTVLKQGYLTQDPVPGLKPRRTLVEDVIARHKLGQPVHLSGRDLAAYLERTLPLPPNSSRLTVGCPQNIDLTGNRRAVCHVDVRKDVAQRMGVWIDSGGLHSIPIDAVIDKRRLQDFAEQSLDDALAGHGFPADAVVDCGSGYIAVAVRGQIKCNASATGKAYVMVATIKDYHGAVQLRFVMPSAKPPPR